MSASCSRWFGNGKFVVFLPHFIAGGSSDLRMTPTGKTVPVPVYSYRHLAHRISNGRKLRFAVYFWPLTYKPPSLHFVDVKNTKFSDAEQGYVWRIDPYIEQKIRK